MQTKRNTENWKINTKRSTGIIHTHHGPTPSNLPLWDTAQIRQYRGNNRISTRIKWPNKQSRVSVLICAGPCFTVSSMLLLRVDSTSVTIAEGYGMSKGACPRAHDARAALGPFQGVGSMSFSSSVMAIVRKRIAATLACNMVITICSRKESLVHLSRDE